MKKFFLTGIAVILFAFSIFLLPSSVNAIAEDEEFVQYQRSLYLENQLPKKQTVLSTDDELFDRFLKYSLCVTDKDALSSEQLAMCRTIFLTERSAPQLLLCPYARQTIKTGVAPERISLDNQKLLADMTGYSPIPFYPDIAYYDLYAAYEFGQPSEIDEYWLYDNGRERVVAQAGAGGPFYQIRFDKMPDPEEADRVADFCFGNWAEQTDGGILYAGDIQAERWIENHNLEVHTSGFWEYIVTDDAAGTAQIIGCTLPNGSDVEPITEPVILPDKLDGYTVTGISARLADTGITKLVIPECYTNVQTFVNMPYLKEAEIYAPELELSDGLFMSCPKLESVSLHVKKIGLRVCPRCPEVKSAVITSAEEIACWAFKDLSKLEEVTLPDNLKYLGQDAFSGTALRELTIPKSTEIVGVLHNPYIQKGVLIDPLTAEQILIADEDCVIKGYSDTEAQFYAAENGYTFVSLDETANGDVNGDDTVSVADAVLMMKWLIGDPNVELNNWRVGDFNKDGVLNVVDLSLLKRGLLGTESVR